MPVLPLVVGNPDPTAAKIAAYFGPHHTTMGVASGRLGWAVLSGKVAGVELGIRDRRYLVVGGTAGMGLAAAQVLAADGARVAIAGRDVERANAAVDRIASPRVS